MENFSEEILSLLDGINCNGSFVATGIHDLVVPGLSVNKVGEISLPISAAQAQALIGVAHKAPFGKGMATVVDTSVRSAWEIDAQEVSFNNPQWKSLLKEVLNTVKEQLGLDEKDIEAQAYKLLIYEKDDFFVWHKDSEKVSNMFGTLVITFPSEHQGGELAVRFNGEEVVVSAAEAVRNYQYSFAAFYADCDHEVRPLLSGYRVCMVYNLVQTKTNISALSANSLLEDIEYCTELLQQHESEFASPKAILLEHQYTPENFSMDHLKLDDLPRVRVLLAAAEKAGFFARLGLVTHYQSGTLEYEGYYSYYDHEDDEGIDTDSVSMGEIFDESISVEHWASEEKGTLGDYYLEETDIIKTFELGEDDPLEKEAEGYTGNAGMTLTYWYHYGAVILWPKSIHLQVLQATGHDVATEWMGFYAQTAATDPVAMHHIRQLLDSLDINAIANTRHATEKMDMEGYLDGILVLRDNALVQQHEGILAAAFTKINIPYWMKCLQQFPLELSTSIFEKAIERPDKNNIPHWASIVETLLTSNLLPEFVGIQAQKVVEKTPAFHHFFAYDEQQKQYSDFGYGRTNREIPEEYSNKGIATLRTIFKLCQQYGEDTTWFSGILQLLTSVQDRSFFVKMLLPVLFDAEQYKQYRLYPLMYNYAIDVLQQKTAIRPEPLPNWTRQRPNTQHDTQIWDELEQFLLSPTQQTFDYARVEAERRIMESVIQKVEIDLSCETIKKGRPYTLRLTKNNNEYERNLKIWHDDLQLLKKLEETR
ncbi:MAG TPA: 2OG-Fe(II) oxygenase [Chitinophagales bacterium]|nr:2OG-Fe(II) oxygenase [Chitinophagales bacterium]